MDKIDHIGIVVENLEKSNFIFSKLLAREPYKREIVESEGVEVSFFQIGESKIELIANIGNSQSLQKFLDTKGEGLHHIAFEVEDIQKEMTRLQSEGFRLLSEKVKRGADDKWICFLHPKDSSGVLVELVQSMNTI